MPVPAGAGNRVMRAGAPLWTPIPAIEIDPLYVDTALRRLMVAMDCAAVHIDGRPFKEVADDRLGQKEAADG